MSVILGEQMPAIYFQVTSKENPCSYLFIHTTALHRCMNS